MLFYLRTTKECVTQDDMRKFLEGVKTSISQDGNVVEFRFHLDNNLVGLKELSFGFSYDEEKKEETVKEDTDKSSTQNKVAKVRKKEADDGIDIKKVSKMEVRRRRFRFKDFKCSKLDEIAENSISFDNFLDNVCEWLEVNQNVTLTLKKVEKRAVEAIKSGVQSVNWYDFEVSNFKSTSGPRSHKVIMNDALKEKMPEIKMLKFINKITSYHDYNFKNSVTKSNAVKNVEEGENAEEKQIEPKATKKSVNKSSIACLPYVPEFEEKLNSIDQSLDVEKKIEAIMELMDGWSKLKEEQKETILRLLKFAVKSKRVTLDAEERMELSTFVNSYIRKYGKEEKVKSIKFIKDLRKFLNVKL